MRTLPRPTLPRSLAPLLFTLAATPLARATLAQEDGVHRLRGANVAVYNLAGKVRVQASSTDAVEVALERGGADAARLTVASGPHGERESLRIVYPGDTVLYRPGDERGNQGKSETELRVRDNGTFSDQGLPPGQRKVRIRNHGEGLEAWADLVIGVPEGQHFELYLGVGHVDVSNVSGTLRIDTGAAKIVSRGTRGRLELDSGSGSIQVSDAAGELVVDTGSGAVELEGVTGAKLSVDTGSGRVSVRGAKVESLAVDTGSGRIELLDSEASHLTLDTGSGSVQAQLNRAFEEVVIDTGSGSVTVELPDGAGTRFVLDSGSGSLQVDLPHEVTGKGRGERRGTIGDGHGLLKVDTGSGSIRLLRRA